MFALTAPSFAYGSRLRFHSNCTYICAVEHTAVSKVVLFVASGGGGSQARPKVLAEWRPLGCRGWCPRVHPDPVATWERRSSIGGLSGEQGGFLVPFVGGFASDWRVWFRSFLT